MCWSGGKPGSRMLLKTQFLVPVESMRVWTRKPCGHLLQSSSTTCNLILFLIHSVFFLLHGPHHPGPCVVIICIFVFLPLPGLEHFSFSESLELVHSWHRCVLRVMGFAKKGIGWTQHVVLFMSQTRPPGLLFTNFPSVFVLNQTVQRNLNCLLYCFVNQQKSLVCLPTGALRK